MRRKSFLVSFVVLVIGVLILGSIVFDNRSDNTIAKAKISMEELKRKEDERVRQLHPLYQKLYFHDIKSIKLIGDSITAGVGSSGHSTPETNTVIFEEKDEIYYEGKQTTKSWANLLRNYTQSIQIQLPEYLNAGIGGKSAEWTLHHIDSLIQDEDVVFVMLGTNDRLNGTVEGYEEIMRELLSIIDERSELMIVMSPPPSSNSYADFNFEAKDIDTVLKRISDENDYNFISQYDAINNYLEENEEVEYEDLMETVGAHPTDKGYEVMWKEIRKKFDLN